MFNRRLDVLSCSQDTSYISKETAHKIDVYTKNMGLSPPASKTGTWRCIHFIQIPHQIYVTLLVVTIKQIKKQSLNYQPHTSRIHVTGTFTDPWMVGFFLLISCETCIVKKNIESKNLAKPVGPCKVYLPTWVVDFYGTVNVGSNGKVFSCRPIPPTAQWFVKNESGLLVLLASICVLPQNLWMAYHWVAWFCLRCLEQVILKHIPPNWWLFMVIYHGRIRKNPLKTNPR